MVTVASCVNRYCITSMLHHLDQRNFLCYKCHNAHLSGQHLGYCTAKCADNSIQHSTSCTALALLTNEYCSNMYLKPIFVCLFVLFV